MPRALALVRYALQPFHQLFAEAQARGVGFVAGHLGIDEFLAEKLIGSQAGEQLYFFDREFNVNSCHLISVHALVALKREADFEGRLRGVNRTGRLSSDDPRVGRSAQAFTSIG